MVLFLQLGKDLVGVGGCVCFPTKHRGCLALENLGLALRPQSPSTAGFRKASLPQHCSVLPVLYTLEGAGNRRSQIASLS